MHAHVYINPAREFLYLSLRIFLYFIASFYIDGCLLTPILLLCRVRLDLINETLNFVL